MALDARGWQLVVTALGHRTRYPQILEIRLSVEAIVLALPGGALAAEAAKAALLRRRAGVPLATGACSLALGKGLLVGAESIYLGITAAWLGWLALSGQGPPSPIVAALAAAGAAITGLASVALMMLLRDARLATRLADRLTSLPIASLRRWVEQRRSATQRLDAEARRFFESTRGSSFRYLAPFLVTWLVEGFEMALILHCLGVSLGLGEAFALDGVGSLLRALAFFVPAGLGIQDAAQVLLLGALGVRDPVATGAALIFIKRTKEVLWVVAGATFLAVRRDLWRQTKSSQA
jgi:glycosyltransferase 2 family protein